MQFVTDPGLAPASAFCVSIYAGFSLTFDFLTIAGTPEAGGWTTREVKRIIRGLAGLNFVCAQLLFVSVSTLI
jgi:hypothetical protein